MHNKLSKFEIPGWVRWVAQDSSGVWWGYSVEPLRNENGWYENEVGDYVRLGINQAEDWQQSLTKVDNTTVKKIL